jgi:hypothetical protein
MYFVGFVSENGNVCFSHAGYEISRETIYLETIHVDRGWYESRLLEFSGARWGFSMLVDRVHSPNWLWKGIDSKYLGKDPSATQLNETSRSTLEKRICISPSCPFNMEMSLFRCGSIARMHSSLLHEVRFCEVVSVLRARETRLQLTGVHRFTSSSLSISILKAAAFSNALKLVIHLPCLPRRQACDSCHQTRDETRTASMTGQISKT